MELVGFEPTAFRMQSGRATTALKPHFTNRFTTGSLQFPYRFHYLHEFIVNLVECDRSVIIVVRPHSALANPGPSENRDRGGIQWNSEPTSPPEPLLKMHTIYVGFSGLSNVQKISSGRGGEHCENRNVSTRNDTTSPK